MIDTLKKKIIDEIGLAISNNKDNLIYQEIAKSNGIKFVLGDDTDVLSRLIKCGKKLKATDILRITSESPFPHLENLPKIWKKHVLENYDATFLDNIVDGCGYEILKLDTLKTSYKKGKKNISLNCVLYLLEKIIKNLIFKEFYQIKNTLERT